MVLTKSGWLQSDTEMACDLYGCPPDAPISNLIGQVGISWPNAIAPEIRPEPETSDEHINKHISIEGVHLCHRYSKEQS